ncbi:MAG: TAXI family TRAP transporter solute-binding subunit [Nitrospinaceae bacterium]|jgi:uncharacterized protein|nr:TAXI family TRAP transporter solute-binding subunit [Nitrospinaceae bacterium]MBT3821521.1 TAXI family TRAP transporter solute-binding subunit [Nitrospinaceae bacterium]MBT4093949.1 TAXI family TRAP transporter solute-binding subunit [Nitrospinaceae bacterium]MBT4432718.1 TAXI family TRAP transporter solute-binding subunit [Nitrospinaceae bacterium]MBT5369216.1 TAXI family TRAP transporter solute-binding subunit [Nitrospinaceae bacterium]
MRKFLTVAAIMAMAASFTAVETAQAAKQFTIAIGSARGTMGRLGAGLSELLNKKQAGVKYSVVPGGGGRANPARVGSGGTDFGYSFSNFSAAAYAGKTPFKKAYPNLRGVSTFYSSCYHQYVGAELYKAGYKNWKAMATSKKPLNIAMSKKGTSTEYVAQLAVKMYGTSYKELVKKGFKLTFPGAGGMSRAIRSRQIDFYFHNSGDPNGAGIQATLGRDLRLMQMEDDMKKMLKSNGFSACTIPGGMYKGNPNPTSSMGLNGVLLTTDKMDPNVVYNMLKLTKENKKFLTGVHKIYGSWDAMKAGKGVGVPMHPGAKRFFKEIGGAM